MMKIKRIRLKNVKSYVDQTISFHEGVNFISGPNGSGKSTIVESIGYALFGCKPEYRFSDFIRHGQRRGEIEIWIEANDEREYRVVRRFTSRSGGAWLILDEETGLELESGEADVKDWLRENLGLSAGLEPENLFKTVIGVRQGTFAAPFLSTPKERERYFNSILNLESYREAFERTREAEGLLRSEIDLLSERIKILSERCQGYEEVKEELEKVKSELRSVEEREKNLSIKLDERRKLLEAQQELQEEIKFRQEEIAKLEKRIERTKAERKGIEDKINEARKAAEVLKLTEPEHKRYLQIESELEELEERRKERDSLQKEAQGLQNTVSALRAKSNELTRFYSEESQRLEAEIETLSQEIEGIESQMEGVSRKLEEMDERMKQFDEIEAKLDELREIERVVERISHTISQMKERIEELKEEREGLMERVSRLGELKDEVARGERIEEELNLKRSELAALQERLKTARKNARLAKGGRCPLLSIPCPAVEGGDLETFFQDQIESIKADISRCKAEMEPMEAEVQRLKLLRQKLTKLEGDRDRLKRIEDEIEDVSERLTRQVSSIPISRINGELADLRDKLAVAGMRMEIEYPSAQVERPDELVAQMENIIQSVGQEVEGALRKLREDRERRSNRLSALKAERNSKTKRLRQIRSQRDKLERTRAEIESLNEEIRVKEGDYERLSERLKRFEGLEEEISKLRNERERVREGHERYIRNERTARQIDELRKSLASKELELGELEQHHELLNVRLESLRSKFDPELLSRLQEEVNRLSEELAAVGERARGLKRDRERLEGQIGEMEEMRRQIEEASRQREESERALELLSFLRNRVLNVAGDRIASRYRESIALEASRLYREISGEPVVLRWDDSFEITLVDRTGKNERRRSFKQLSGGEQMSAALAIRLALLSFLSDARLGIFDEPTVNLDEDRRLNLARAIPFAVRNFSQLFIISHDDSFDSITENVIRLEKDERAGSRLVG